MTRPTHMHAATGSLVFAGGYDPADLEALPEGYWEAADLEAARASRWAAVKALRNAHEYGGCETPLGAVDSDETAKLQISGAVQMAMLSIQFGEPFSIEWTMLDNSTVTHSAAQMIALGVAVGQHVVSCRTAATALRTAINAATTIEEIEAIDIETGWPA